MSIERQIIEQMDGELFASELSLETVERSLRDAGWEAAFEPAGNPWNPDSPVKTQWWSHGSTPDVSIRIEFSAKYDKDIEESIIELIEASGWVYRGGTERVWVVEDFNTAAGFGEFEEYMNNPEDWAE